VWDVLRKHFILGATFVRLLLWKMAIARDQYAGEYTDLALTPVAEDEDKMLDLLTKTKGGRAAVAHARKVAELTGAS